MEGGILIRDISCHNILLGVEGAPVGWRGVLIDFDMAIKINRTSHPFVIDAQRV